MNFNDLKDRINYIFQNITDKFGSAMSTERDRRAIIIGLAGILFFVAFFSYKSFSKNSESYSKQIEILENQLAEIKSLKQQYKTSAATLKQLTKSVKKEEEALISVVERILVDNQIERTSFSIKDSNFSTPGSEDIYDEKSVQVDIRRVTMNKIVDVLYKFQTRGSFLKVSDLRLKTKFDKPDLVDASFRLSTFEFKQVI